MLCTSKRVLFEDQNYFIKHISQGGVAQLVHVTVAIATHTNIIPHTDTMLTQIHTFTPNYIIDILLLSKV